MLLRIENIKGIIYIEEEKLPVLEEYFRTEKIKKEDHSKNFVDNVMKMED